MLLIQDGVPNASGWELCLSVWLAAVTPAGKNLFLLAVGLYFQNFDCF